MSHVCQNIGDWYIRIASLLALDRLAPNSATAISILVLVKLGPHALLPSLGGALADSLDRKKVMMTLDLSGALITLGFVVALKINSLVFFYIIAALRAAVHSLYAPTTKALVPMIVSDYEDLKRAMTINGLSWAFLLMIGGAFAGATAAFIGLEACFAFDSLTYCISAFVLCFIRGNFKVLRETETLAGSDDPALAGKKRNIRDISLRITRPFVEFVRMTIEAICYLWKCGFGPVIFLNSTGGILWGSTDVLNMAYAHVADNEVLTSERLGITLTCLGAGCFVGPLFANVFTDLACPSTLQFSCVGAIAFMMCGWIGISQSSSFSMFCSFLFVRGVGECIIWVNASLLLQRLTAQEMLGRVLALEFAFMMIAESVTAYLAGFMIDAGLTKHQIAGLLSVVAAGFLAFWSVYHILGFGGARKEFNQSSSLVRDCKEASFVVAQIR